MQSVTVFTAYFNISLSPDQVIPFRKYITSLIGLWRKDLKALKVQTDYFHNHDEKTGKNINRFPLIQYRRADNKAAITGIDKAAAFVKIFGDMVNEREPAAPGFSLDRTYLRDFPLEMKSSLEKNYRIHEIPDKTFREYSLAEWLPMDKEKYEEWLEAVKLRKRIHVLDDCLEKQLMRFLEAVGYKGKAPKAYLTEIMHSKWAKEYHFNKMCLDVRFACNLSLPENIGIGQVPGIGFGYLRIK